MALGASDRVCLGDCDLERGFYMDEGTLGVIRVIDRMFVAKRGGDLDPSIRDVLTRIGKKDCLALLERLRDGNFRRSISLDTYSQIIFAAISDAVIKVRASIVSALERSFEKPAPSVVVAEAKPLGSSIKPTKVQPYPQKAPDDAYIKGILQNGSFNEVIDLLARFPGALLSEFVLILTLPCAEEVLLFAAKKYPSEIIIRSPLFLDRDFAYGVLFTAAVIVPEIAIKMFPKYQGLDGSDKILAAAKKALLKRPS